MSEIRNPAKPSLASNLSKLMSGIKSSDKPVNELTDPLVDKSTDTPVNESTDPLVDKSTDKPVNSLTSPLVDSSTNIPVNELADPPVDKSTDISVNELTNTLVDKSTNIPVNELTGSLVDKLTAETTHKKLKKTKTIIKGFHLEPLDFDALNFYAVSRREDKSAIIRRLIRENIPKHFYDMAKTNQDVE